MNKSKTNISVKSNTGTRVRSSVIIGEQGTFTSGDILDANATAELVQDKVQDIIGDASEDLDTLKEIADAITNNPAPTKLSELTNDAGYTTADDLSDVALSGDYEDLTNKPQDIVTAFNEESGTVYIGSNPDNNQGPIIFPVEGSLAASPVDIDGTTYYVLTCSMQDGSKRILKIDGGFPATPNALDGYALFEIFPDSLPWGETEEMPDDFCPFEIVDFEENNPSDFAEINANISAYDWEWSGEDASYKAALFVKNINLNGSRSYLTTSDPSPMYVRIFNT